MARDYVKQPNGKYAIWSNVVDSFILVNATKKEVERFFVKEKKDDAKKQIRRYLDEADRGKTHETFEEYMDMMDKHDRREVEEALEDDESQQL